MLEGIAGASKLAGEHTVEWRKVETALRDTSSALQDDSNHLRRSAESIARAAETHRVAATVIEGSVSALERLIKGRSLRRTFWDRLRGK
jgi:hypothetical protein